MRSPCLLCLFALALTIGAGCSAGGNLVKAKGQLTQHGKPLKVDPKSGVTIVFTLVPVEGQKKDEFVAASPDPADATFAVPGRDGNGIPAGKYRISVEILSLTPSAEITRINTVYNRTATKIEREVKDETPIVLDLSKPEG